MKGLKKKINIIQDSYNVQGTKQDIKKVRKDDRELIEGDLDFRIEKILTIVKSINRNKGSDRELS